MNSRYFQSDSIHEERFELAKFALYFILFLLAVFLPGCGQDTQSIPVNQTAQRWAVQADADLLSQERAWEICGGTVTCTFTREAPPNKPAIVGFIGEATANQKRCYEQYGTSLSVDLTDGTPEQCRAYEVNP
jgi:hypothetical protein